MPRALAQPRTPLPQAIRLILLGGALACLGCGGDDSATRDLIAEAQAALGRGDYQRAESLASQVPEDNADWVASRLIAGDAAMRAQRYDAASEFFQSVPRDGSSESVAAAFSLGEVHRQLGRLDDARQQYEYVLDQHPDEVSALERLAFLDTTTGRHWSARPHYLKLVQLGAASYEQLAILGDLERPAEKGDYLRECSRQAPDDPLVLLGLAADALYMGQTADAHRRFQEVVARDPELIAAQAALGELLVTGDERTFAAWHAALPQSAEANADIWYVRGLWARRQGRLDAATRCFWEALRLEPTHRRATYQLGQVLAGMNDPAAPQFVARAEQLFQLTYGLDRVFQRQGRDESSVKSVAELLESAGRLWEAAAWARYAAEAFPLARWPAPLLSRAADHLAADTPQVIDSHNLALAYDFSSRPDHRGLLAEIGPSVASPVETNGGAKIQFSQEDDVGLHFEYFNGHDPATTGARMMEQTGGGVAAFDFDRDDCPDLYFTQGCEWPDGATLPAPSPDFTDRVFRNDRGRRFLDVTIRARLGSEAFGQGCAAGDFDNDGFPDLYVATTGRNELYRNNGDGTFTNVTGASGLGSEAWTTSCVIADLNGDGLPDLFDVNYVTGKDVFTLICNGRGCSPTNFEGARDVVHLNRGDGSFLPVPDATPEKDSKGLGVVVLRLADDRLPSLFIANDQVPNFLLRAADQSQTFRYTNQAFLNGLAFNDDGLAMACMGIAADDANGDGLLDLFVTNFADEANTLYLQDSPGMFVDTTKLSGLIGPSLPFVGWGTQFLDADLDGDSDLVLVNGHIDDYRDEGGLYHMRPQFLENVDHGRFVERLGSDVGDFFDREVLGRALARLDWDGDGRMDFVVSNMRDPAALVSNRTEGTGSFLNLRLHATRTARDAVGTIVHVTTGAVRWTKQLTAGDGYQASNERLLQFGLGTATSADLTIKWPSGHVTLLADVPTGTTLELTEDAPRATLRIGGRMASLAVASGAVERP